MLWPFLHLGGLQHGLVCTNIEIMRSNFANTGSIADGQVSGADEPCRLLYSTEDLLQWSERVQSEQT